MKIKLKKCSCSMALYLYRKWNNGDITEDQIRNIFTDDAYCDIFGGWFCDFFYESVLDSVHY